MSLHDPKPSCPQYGIFLLRDGSWKAHWLDLPKWVADREAALIEGAKVFVRVSA